MTNDLTPALPDDQLLLALATALARVEDHLGGPHLRLASTDPDFLPLEIVREALAKALARGIDPRRARS